MVRYFLRVVDVIVLDVKFSNNANILKNLICENVYVGLCTIEYVLMSVEHLAFFYYLCALL